MVECSFPPPIRPSLLGHPCRRNPGLAALESSVAALANKMSVGVSDPLLKKLSRPSHGSVPDLLLLGKWQHLI